MSKSPKGTSCPKRTPATCVTGSTHQKQLVIPAHHALPALRPVGISSSVKQKLKPHPSSLLSPSCNTIWSSVNQVGRIRSSRFVQSSWQMRYLILESFLQRLFFQYSMPIWPNATVYCDYKKFRVVPSQCCKDHLRPLGMRLLCGAESVLETIFHPPSNVSTCRLASKPCLDAYRGRT